MLKACLLQCSPRQVPLKERASHMYSIVVACLLWGLEVWAPSRRARRANDIIESAKVRWLRRTYDVRAVG